MGSGKSLPCKDYEIRPNYWTIPKLTLKWISWMNGGWMDDEWLERGYYSSPAWGWMGKSWPPIHPHSPFICYVLSDTFGTQALYGHYPNIKGHQSLTFRLYVWLPWFPLLYLEGSPRLLIIPLALPSKTPFSPRTFCSIMSVFALGLDLCLTWIFQVKYEMRH